MSGDKLAIGTSSIVPNPFRSAISVLQALRLAHTHTHLHEVWLLKLCRNVNAILS